MVLPLLNSGPHKDYQDYEEIEEERSSTKFLELLIFTLVILFCIIPSILGVLLALLAYYRKWKSRWLVIAGSVVTGIVLMMNLGTDYISGMTLLISRIPEGEETKLPFSQVLPDALLLMMPVTVSLGVLLGGIFVWLARKRPELIGLPVKVEDKTNITIKVDQRKLRNLPDIENGVILGLDNENKPVTLSDKEANMHVFISGATGAGKTNTIRVILDSAIRRGKPVIVVDGKGDPEFLREVKGMSELYGRTFQGFSYTGDVHYNPLRHGNATELKDKLIAVEHWTEPYYKRAAERYLQLVFKSLQLAEKPIDLHIVQDMLTQKNLMGVLKSKELVNKIGKEQANKMKEYVNTLDANHRNALDGLKDRLALITESNVGHLFAESQHDEKVIDFFEAIKDKRVVHMSLSGLSYSSFTPALGAMIVEDLKSTASAIAQHGWIDHVYVILDEFNLFAGDQVVNMINKSRSAGFCCLVATQELADLSAAGGDELIGQIIGNTNVKITHRQDVPSSAELLAEVVGTKVVFDHARNVQTTILGDMGTGLSNIRQVEEYRVHPNTLKNLGQGQAVVIKKIPDNTVSPTQIRPAPDISKRLKR